MEGLKPKGNGGQEKKQSKNQQRLCCSVTQVCQNVLVPGWRSSHTLHIQPLLQVQVPPPFRCTDVFDISLRQQCRGHRCDALHTTETLAEICSAKFQSDLRGVKGKVSLRGRGHCDGRIYFIFFFPNEAHLILFKAVLHLLLFQKGETVKRIREEVRRP